MPKPKFNLLSRRKFLTDTGKASLGTALALSLPTIVPSSVFGKNAPSNRINVASIGCGRISTSHDMTEIARYAGARIMAVCDVDTKRAEYGPLAVKNNYLKAKKENGGLTGDWDIKVYTDYKELLLNTRSPACHCWSACSSCGQRCLPAKACVTNY